MESLDEYQDCRYVNTVLYFFDDPVHSVLSLFRRFFYRTQVRLVVFGFFQAVLRFVSFGLWGIKISRLAIWTPPKCRMPFKDINAGQYADLGHDPLMLMEHVADWLVGFLWFFKTSRLLPRARVHNEFIYRFRHGCDPSTPYPVVFARRSTMWRYYDQLAAVLGVDAALIPASEKVAYEANKEHAAAEAALVTRLLVLCFLPLCLV
jgi:hypothetical protein